VKVNFVRGKKYVSIITHAYSLVRPDKLLQISLFRRAFILAYFLYKNLFEDPFWKLIQRNPELFQNGDVLDIGANIGYTACLFAHAMKVGSKVYAFEPDRLSFGLLGEVIHRKNLMEAIEVVNMAVGSSDGQVEFWHNKEHSADHRVVTEQFRSHALDDANISIVSETTIDTFVRNRNLQNICFIKIDVQGYELAVCEGMRETLRRFPELCVCLEYCPDAMSDLGFEHTKLLDFFRTRGYQVHMLTSENLELLTDDASLLRFVREVGYVDLLCSKRVLTS
jgi:FkbM family methyltransferase